MSEAPIPSVRESLQAALASADAPEPVTAAAAPAGDGGSEIIEPVVAAPVAEAPAAGGPARDATGKFAPKTQDTPAEAGAAETATPPAATPTIETAKPEEKGPQLEATRIPPSLSAAVKAQWSDLPPVVRDEFSRLEESFQKGKAEWAPKGQRLNRFEEILGPRVDQWRLAGLDEFSGIQALLAAQDILERDPVGGLSHIARSYGVDLRSLAGQAVQQRPGAEGQPAPTADLGLQTALDPIMREVRTLQQRWDQSQQQSEQQKVAEAQTTVHAFANDPANLYFDNVRVDVADRLTAAHAAGRDLSLKDAYEAAIWASSEIRPLLLADQAKTTQAAAQVKAQEQAARTKAQTAQHAAGSVTGAPAPGAQAPVGPPGTVRDTLQAAAREVGWNV